jgi:hypothetical protein
MQAFEEQMRRGGAPAIEHVGRFAMRQDPVHQTVARIARRLDELGIPYAIAGGMALAAHGYVRATVDVDILVTPEGLKLIHEHLEGLGYVPLFEKSRHLRDAETGVRVEFLTTGAFPGDGKPKPVAFPDPAQCAVEIEGARYLRLPALVELKLASGMSAPHRAKDIGDVVSLIEELGLGEEFAQQLHPFVRAKYLELWRAVEEDRRNPDRFG